jgi:enamine deaminase RidA (YjgF/YER057c/UK114 family)
LPEVLENADLDLTTQMRNLIDLLWNEWKTVEDQIEGLSLELERIRDVFGADKLPVRMVLGVASLPLGMPVELEVSSTAKPDIPP